MKLLFIVLVLFTNLIAEEECENQKKYGYSYVAIGMQHTSYKQVFNSTSSDYTLKSNSISPYYTTATLTRINEKFGFEIYAASTLFAKRTTEDVLSDKPTVSHSLDMSLTDIAFTLHYKPYSEHHRVTFAARYIYEVLKRYDFKDEPLKSIGMVENRIATVSVDVGYLYVSQLHTGVEGLNYRLGSALGIPFIAATADTYPSNQLDIGTTFGYKFNANAYLGYTVFKGVELGGYLDYMYILKSTSTNYQDFDGNIITSKDSSMNSMRYGFMASWSF